MSKVAISLSDVKRTLDDSNLLGYKINTKFNKSQLKLESDQSDELMLVISILIMIYIYQISNINNTPENHEQLMNEIANMHEVWSDGASGVSKGKMKGYLERMKQLSKYSRMDYLGDGNNFSKNNKDKENGPAFRKRGAPPTQNVVLKIKWFGESKWQIRIGLVSLPKEKSLTIYDVFLKQ